MSQLESQTRTLTYQQASQRQKQNQLVLDHLDYVSHILSRILTRLPETVDVENLQSAGVVGLIEAAQKFDETRGVAFKTFAYPRIRGAIIDELRQNSPLSQKMMEIVRKIREAIECLEPPISVESISQLTGLSINKVEEGLEAMRIHPQQWDPSASENSKSCWSNESPDEPSNLEEQKKLLADAVEELPERERLVVTLYYLEGLRLKEIGVVLNLSESRVSRLLAKAELTLKQYCQVDF